MSKRARQLRKARRRSSCGVRLAVACLSVVGICTGAFYASASAKSKASIPGVTAPSPGVQGTANASLTYEGWGSETSTENEWNAYTTEFPKDAKAQSYTANSAGANDQDTVSAFRLALSSGSNIPDMVQLNRTEVPEFAAAGELTNLTAYVKEISSGHVCGLAGVSDI